MPVLRPAQIGSYANPSVPLPPLRLPSPPSPSSSSSFSPPSIRRPRSPQPPHRISSLSRRCTPDVSATPRPTRGGGASRRRPGQATSRSRSAGGTTQLSIVVLPVLDMLEAVLRAPRHRLWRSRIQVVPPHAYMRYAPASSLRFRLSRCAQVSRCSYTDPGGSRESTISMGGMSTGTSCSISPVY